jgi:geranylgeranyl diphosphate synthase type I
MAAAASEHGRAFEQVVAAVNGRLDAFLTEQERIAAQISPRAPELVEALGQLTRRGGKRLRPVVLYAGYRAAGGGESVAPTLDACASLELLQTYLLIQDDWMDGDDERRGGPSVHAALRRAHGDAHLGESLAILAADLAAGFAFELIARAPFPSARLQEALATFGRMHFEVVSGQQLDLCKHDDVALTHQLKTGSYTVRGPLALGALLAGASPAQLAALERFGTPIGVAFQLRDDLLGTFGDKAAVGKPVGADLRAGKRTALIAEAYAILPSHEREALERVLGKPHASDSDVHAATTLLERCGARRRVESRLAGLEQQARDALEDESLAPSGRALLAGLLEALLKRNA